MPDYEVTLSDGRKFRVTATAQPSEADVLKAIGLQPQASHEEPKAPVGGMLPTAGALVGSTIGTLGGEPGRIAGAAVGGGLGKGAEMLLDSQPQSFGEGLREMGVAGAEQGAGELAGGLVGRGLKAVGGGLYHAGVGLLPKGLKQQYPELAKTGLKEGIALTKRGAVEAEKRVGQSAATADSMIADAQRAGAPPINPRKVVRELRPVADKMERRAALGMADERPTVALRARAFASHGKGGLPLTRAQALKREAQDAAESAYRAQDKGATVNSTELLMNEAQGRGLRRELEQAVPGVGPVNARTQGLMGIQRAAEHASGTGHALSRLGGGGLAAGLASAGGALPALLAAGGGLAMTTPGGLTGTGMFFRKALAPMASHSPQALRLAALMAQLSSQQ